MKKAFVSAFVSTIITLRAYLGVGAGICYILHDFFFGSVLFACGLFLKLVDVPLAKAMGEPIPADDSLYRVSAMLFNGAAFAGLMYALATLAYAGGISWFYPIFLLAFEAALMSMSLFGKWVSWVRPHSVFAKARSGSISLPIALFPILFPTVVSYSTTMYILAVVSAVLIVAESGYKAWYYSLCQSI